MNKISTEIIMEALLEAGVAEEKAASIISNCRQKAEKEAADKEKDKKPQNDGYIVLVKDKHGILSETASALIVKRMQSTKDLQGNDVAPYFWDVDELQTRVALWREGAIEAKEKFANVTNFSEMMQSFPKKLARQYGFSFVSKETVPVLSISSGSVMYNTYELNDIRRTEKLD